MKDDWTSEDIEQALEEDETATLKAKGMRGKEPMRFLDVFVGWLTGVLMGAVIFILATGVSGCVYRGAKVTEGVDFALGINVPTAEGTFQFDLINYLSGFRLGVAENARLELRYTHAETNEYFGCVTTRTYKTVDAVVEPCEVTSTNAPSAGATACACSPCACGDECKCAAGQNCTCANCAPTE